MDPRYTRILIAIASAITILLLAVTVIVVTGDDEEPQATTAAPTTTVETTVTTSEPSATSSPTTAPTTTLSPTTTATTAAPTSTTTSTTSSTTTTTAAPSGACSGLPPIAVGGGASDQTLAFGDVDGDGADDTVTVYREVGSWWLNVQLDYGWSTEIPVTGMVARAVDVANFGVGEEVIIAQIDSGASAEIFGLFAFQGCDIIQLIDGNTGFDTAFPVGGTVTHLDGFSCNPDGITVRSAAVDPGDPALWEYTETTYVYVPGLGEMQPMASSIQLLTSPADDGVIFGTATYGC